MSDVNCGREIREPSLGLTVFPLPPLKSTDLTVKGWKTESVFHVARSEMYYFFILLELITGGGVNCAKTCLLLFSYTPHLLNTFSIKEAFPF